MNQLQQAAAIMGKKGGKSGTGQSKARTRDQCSRAAIKRWGFLSPGERFWKYVKVGTPEECWIWTGGTNEHGYGIGWFSKKIMKAHRIAWIVTNGPIPDRANVLHKCDNPPCVNPSHLFLGTLKENMEDAARKGRTTQGQRHWNCKLTKEQIEEMKELAKTHTYPALGKQFGVHFVTVERIVNGRSWRHTVKSKHQPQQIPGSFLQKEQIQGQV